MCHSPVHEPVAGPIAVPSSNDDLPALLHSDSTGVQHAVREIEGALHPWVVEGPVVCVTADILSTHY